ncbi:MAG: hypothetical protein ACYC35_27830 [Pirellulales bacterium]
MPATDSSRFLSPSPIEPVWTNVDAATPFSRDAAREAADHSAWQQLIDHKLIEWGRDPDAIEDEGVDAPTRATVCSAIELAKTLGAAGLPAPGSVARDPNGGIVFEFCEKNVTEVFYVWDDGTIEYQKFEGSRLIERRRL